MLTLLSLTSKLMHSSLFNQTMWDKKHYNEVKSVILCKIVLKLSVFWRTFLFNSVPQRIINSKKSEKRFPRALVKNPFFFEWREKHVALPICAILFIETSVSFCQLTNCKYCKPPHMMPLSQLNLWIQMNILIWVGDWDTHTRATQEEQE